MRISPALLLAAAWPLIPVAAAAPLTLRVSAESKPISPDLFGIFFEDINWAADGGLYAELVQNRSFEYQATEQRDWNSLTAWQPVERGASKGSVRVRDAFPVHPNNPHYVVLGTNTAGEGFGIQNGGFDGIPVREGERYTLSLFAQQLYVGDRWRGGPERRGTLTLVRSRGKTTTFVLNKVKPRVKEVTDARRGLAGGGEVAPVDLPDLAEVDRSYAAGLGVVEVTGAKSVEDFVALWQYVASKLGFKS